MQQIKLKNKLSPIKGSVILPGSKSMSNRLLIIQALAGGQIPIENLSEASDTTSLQHYLKFIETCSVSSIPLVIDVENAGTVLRFLTAYLSIKEGTCLLTGSERMKERPIKQLVVALQQLRSKITYAGKRNFPPLRIVGSQIEGGKLTVDASESSQFVTALMLIAPYLEGGLQINLLNRAVSFSYILMTQKLMQAYGVEVSVNPNQVVVKPGNYKLKSFAVEPDWSAASYWYEMVSLSSNADIFIPGLSKHSVQGDRVVAGVFEKLGVATHFEAHGIRLRSKQCAASFSHDFSSCPDLVPSVLASCAGNHVPAVLFGISHLKYKESDRIECMKTELLKTGTILKYKSNSVELIPTKKNLSHLQCEFETYADHRIAMALGALVLKLESVQVNEPQVVNKSYPNFWDQLSKIGLRYDNNA